MFDDQSKPVIARINVPAILRSPALAVLGHSVSATSVVAGPRYKAGHIAAVAGNASSDELTEDNPFYFEALSPNSVQASFLADYIRIVVQGGDQRWTTSPVVDFVTNETTYGRSFRDGFARTYGTTPKTFSVKSGPALNDSAVATADLLAIEPDARIIIIGVAPDTIAPILKAIRRRGIHSPIVLASGAADEAFANGFAGEPEERDTPGFFTENVFAIAPMILDSTGELGQTLAAQCQDATGKSAGWVAAGAQDSARLLVEAIRRAHVGNTEAAKRSDREKVQVALAGIDSPASAVQGINGALYFNVHREMPRLIRYGFFRERRFVSAPLQLVQVRTPDLVDVARETREGHLVQVGAASYWLQRVVYTGIDITRLNRVDVREGTFSADFYLWMCYGGDDDLPTKID